MIQHHHISTHRACGGGIVHIGYDSDKKPQFKCTKCNEIWSCGKDGGKWKKLIMSNQADTK